MTSGGTRPTAPFTPSPSPRPGPFRFLFTNPNLPFTVAIVVGIAAVTAFLLLGGDSGTTAADGTTTTATTETGDGTTLADGDTTEATQPGDTTATTPSTIGEEPIPDDLAPLEGLGLEVIATQIPQPTFATSLPGDDRIFVLERQGRVMVIDPDEGLLETPYLNLLDRISSGGIENGLLGMAFHPEFESNGLLYIYYTDTQIDSRIAEFRADDPAANTVDASTERILIEVDQVADRHRAGMLQFGPDGHLWVAIGDGGMGNRSSQETDNFWGNLLRLDVDGGDPYAIPAGNPFADGGGLPEIWAYGLRNPWRFAIDANERLIYIADVGQTEWEEINVSPIDTPPPDYGWPDFEANACYLPDVGCDQGGWTPPVLVYDHSQGCSVTGGYVYRGDQIPELRGHYFYSDWCNGWVRSFRYDNGVVTQEREWDGDLAFVGQVSSYGVDGDGELLIVTSEGQIARIVPIRGAAPSA